MAARPDVGRASQPIPFIRNNPEDSRRLAGLSDDNPRSTRYRAGHDHRPHTPLVLHAPQFAGGGRIVLTLKKLQQDIRTAARPGGFFYGRQVLQNSIGEPAMLSTTDDLRIRNIKQLRPPDRVTRSHGLVRPAHDLMGSSRPSASTMSSTNVYPFVKAAHADGRTDRETGWIVRVWWERWLERRWFARVLPLLADEVLEDYGLTREGARRICRRPFWRA
jgi:uncharacterized protein YjiS (DUF1127 family)